VWPITVIDGTHVDLQGSSFQHAYTSGGSIGPRVPQWAVPGSILWWRGAYQNETAFKVIDVTQDANNTYIQTNLTGGFPAVPLDGGNLYMNNDPAPEFTCTNCTGGADAVDLSQSPAGAPIYSYSKRTYTGGTLLPYPNQPPFPTLWGKLVSITLSVSKPYTGALGTLTLQATDEPTLESNDSFFRYTPVINLKIAGDRIITPSGVTGAQSADSALSLPGNVWFTGAAFLGPNISSNISGEDPSTWPIVTIEITTDQSQDITPPVISSIASSTATSTATITWMTDEAATSKVVYGTTSAYGSATSSVSLVTSHSIGIIGLTASSTYHYAVVSADSFGNTATSSDQTFTTAAPSGFTPSCMQSSNFLARTSGLDTTHKTAYDNLICGLVTDGVSSKLDALYIFATADTTTAKLNLISSSFNATQSGTLTFSADHGYTGDGSTGYLDTGFTANTGGTNFIQDSAAFGVYILTSSTADHGIQRGTSNSLNSFIWIRPASGVFTYIINGGSSGAPTISNSQGFWVGTRTSSSSISAYKNGSLIDTTPSTSSGVDNISTTLFARHDGSNAFSLFDDLQYSAAFIGGGLTSSDESNLSSRINAYMRAFGINVY